MGDFQAALEHHFDMHTECPNDPSSNKSCMNWISSLYIRVDNEEDLRLRI
jgi:hypothetical protein